GDGSFQGKRIVSQESMNEMHSPQIVVPTSESFRAARQVRFFAAYGFGWQIMDYRGNRLLWHSGNGDGQTSYMALLPDLHLGVALITNTWRVGAPFNGGLAAHIMDHYLGLAGQDDLAALKASWLKNQQKAAEEERALTAARLPNTAPSLPLSAYTGV